MQSTQDLFNTVAKHLLAQGARSANKDGLCRYRGDNGRACAVGVLIKDEHYVECELEKTSVKNACVRNAVSASIGRKLTRDEADMLRDLQKIHDYVSPTQWRQELLKLAEERELNPRVVRDSWSLKNLWKSLKMFANSWKN